MRKQESVHLHALLLEIAEYLDERGETPPVDLAEYEALDVGPAAVHRAKGVHEEAILVLARSIGEAFDRSTDHGTEPRVQ